MSLGVISMKLKTPEKLKKLLPNDYWLLVPWRFYAWHPHHTSRDRSRFLLIFDCLSLFIANECVSCYRFRLFQKVLLYDLEFYIKNFVETATELYLVIDFLPDIRTSVIEKFTCPTRDLPVAVSRTGANFDHCIYSCSHV
jgi:hypothetical protein